MWRTKQLRVNKKRHCGSDLFEKFYNKNSVPFLFLVILQPITYYLTKYLIMNKLRFGA